MSNQNDSYMSGKEILCSLFRSASWICGTKGTTVPFNSVRQPTGKWSIIVLTSIDFADFEVLHPVFDWKKPFFPEHNKYFKNNHMKGNTLNFEMRSELVRNLDVLIIYSWKFSVRGLFECHFPTLSVVTRSSVSRCAQVVHPGGFGYTANGKCNGNGFVLILRDGKMGIKKISETYFCSYTDYFLFRLHFVGTLRIFFYVYCLWSALRVHARLCVCFFTILSSMITRSSHDLPVDAAMTARAKQSRLSPALKSTTFVCCAQVWHDVTLPW